MRTTQNTRLTAEEFIFAQQNRVHVEGILTVDSHDYVISSVSGKARFMEPGQAARDSWLPWGRTSETSEAVLERERLVGTAGLHRSISPRTGVEGAGERKDTVSQTHPNGVIEAAGRDSDESASEVSSGSGPDEPNDLGDSGDEAHNLGGPDAQVVTGSPEGREASSTGPARCLHGEALQSFLGRAIDCRRASFSNTDFTDVSLGRKDYSEATFRHCILHRTTVADAVLRGASFEGARLIGFTSQDIRRMVQKGTDLKGAIIEESTLDGTAGALDLRGVRFERCTFTGTIEGWKLANAAFTQCVFAQMELKDSQAPDTRFERCRFSTSRLVGVSMPRARLVGCYMDRFACRGGSMDRVVYESCTLKHARLLSDHKGARFLRLNLYDAEGKLRSETEESNGRLNMKERNAYALTVVGGDGTVDFTGARFEDSDLRKMRFGYGTVIHDLKICRSLTHGANFNNRAFMVDDEWHIHRPGNEPSVPISSLDHAPKLNIDPPPVAHEDQQRLRRALIAEQMLAITRFMFMRYQV